MTSPLVVAHRGSSSVVAEHTLAAYERAITDGADALECDVRLTNDEHLVCVHDPTLSRTSDARGRVSEAALDDLREADFGGWAGDLPDSADELVGVDRLQSLERVPVPVLALPDLLALVVDCARPVELLVETKHPTRYGGLVEQRLLQTLDRFGLVAAAHPRVTVMSFATSALRRIHAMAPRLPTVQLQRRVPLLFRDGSLPAGTDIAGPAIHILRAHPQYVSRAQAAGHPVYVWTVDEPTDIDLVLSLGVDAVITNRPADVLARVRRQAG